MNIVEFSPSNIKNKQVKVTESVTERKLEKKIPEPIESPSKISSFFQKWWKIMAIIASIIVVVIVVLVVVLVLLRQKKQEDTPTPIEPSISFPPGIDEKEVKKVFSPSFPISTKEKTLSQLSQKSFQTYETTNNGQTSSYTILNKAIIDMYTTNSTSSSNLENILYTTKYTTVITVKSFCSKVTSNPEEDDCQLERQLDLNIQDVSNLRRNEENAEDLI